MTEKYYDIPGYEGIYQITRTGKARSLDRYIRAPQSGGKRKIKGRQLRPYLMKDPCGYYILSLSVDGRQTHLLLHRALAQTFIPNPENKPEVNHIDGVKTNNDLGNLEWCTHKENARHAYDLGLTPAPPVGPGEKSPAAKLTWEKVRTIRQKIDQGIKQGDIAKEYGVSPGTIGFIAANETWVI